MNTKRMWAVAAVGMTIVSGPAVGGVTVTQGSSAPTYSTTLNFDEPGGPTGLVNTTDYVPAGITDFMSGTGTQEVRDRTGDPGFGWAGTGQSAWMPFGAFLTFDSDLTEFSVQVWDNSGPFTGFGGGAGIFMYDDGVQVDAVAFDPAFGGVGEEWLNVTTDGGTVFDKVELVGFGFPADTYIDNLSWNEVPAPGAAALFGLAGLAGVRRRRA